MSDADVTDLINKLLAALREAVVTHPPTNPGRPSGSSGIESTSFEVLGKRGRIGRIETRPGGLASTYYANRVGLGVRVPDDGGSAVPSIACPSYYLSNVPGITSAISGADSQDPFERVWDNFVFQFPLDRPGGAAIVPNEDNWGVGKKGIDPSQFWIRGVKGKGVRIGIADSGLDIDHPAFATLREHQNLKGFAGFDLDGNKQIQTSGTGVPVPDDSATPTFAHWHGTHTAAVLVGSPTDGFQRGFAPEAELVVAQILDNSNQGSVASFKAGFHWLSQQQCDIVSLSLGWAGKHEEWADEIQALINIGAVVVVASGNEFPEEPTRSPGNYPIPGLISVGALTDTGVVWERSGGEKKKWPPNTTVTDRDNNSVVKPSLFAEAPASIVPVAACPGVDIVSAAPGGVYRRETGTSMATPHLAGLIALVLSALRDHNPSAKAPEAASLVLKAMSDIPPTGDDTRSGYGSVDVKSLAALLPTGASNASTSLSAPVIVGTATIYGRSYTVIADGS